jgi:hypothetical protein
VGRLVGRNVGRLVGGRVVGLSVGSAVGRDVGRLVGLNEGRLVGASEGTSVGGRVGQGPANCTRKVWLGQYAILVDWQKIQNGPSLPHTAKSPSIAIGT